MGGGWSWRTGQNVWTAQLRGSERTQAHQGCAECLDHELHGGHPGGGGERASSSSHLRLARCRREPPADILAK